MAIWRLVQGTVLENYNKHQELNRFTFYYNLRTLMLQI